MQEKSLKIEFEVHHILQMEQKPLPPKTTFRSEDYFLQFKYVSSKLDVEAPYLKFVINASITLLFGIVGSTIFVDLVCFDTSTYTGIIRVEKRHLRRVWSALTLTSYEQNYCKFEVLKVSPFLISLANTSRTYDKRKN